MTPEERLAKVKLHWKTVRITCERCAKNISPAPVLPVVCLDELAMANEILKAIRDAVAEERERCERDRS